MGTSLSGLTPATTFDGLLKTSDNDAITSSLKTIGSGDGTDSCLQLSNSALKVNSGQVTIVGAGNTDATTSLLVQNSDGDTLLKVVDDGEVRIGETTGSLTAEGNNVFLRGTNIYFRERLGGYLGNFREEGFQIGNGSAAATARLQVKGSGATSATTSLLVQNSAGSNALKVTDDKNIETYDATGNIIAKNNAGNRRFEINPDLNSLVDFQVSGGGLSNLIRTDSGLNAVGIGANGLANTRFYVKGSGATSATTSLLVENSSGTEHLKITDDGTINARSSITLNHATNSSRSLRLSWGSLYATDNASELNIGAVYSQPTAPRIILGGKTRSGGADAVLVQALNGMYLSTTANTENPSSQLHVKAGTTQDSIAKFEDPRATTDYIEIKNDSTLTDYTGLYWGTSVKIRSKQTGAIFLDCTSGILFANGNSSKNKIDGEGNMSIGTPTIPASTRLTIKGQGATSATTSLLVQNSANNIFSVRDDGALLFYRATNGAELLRIEDTGGSSRFVAGNNADKSLTLGNNAITSAFSSIQFKTYDGAAYSEVMRITGNTDQRVGIGETTLTARLHVKGSGNDATTTALLVQNSDGTDALKVLDGGTQKQVRMTSSQIGSLSLFSSTIEVGTGVKTKIVSNGLAVNRDYTTADAMLHVKGSGATSATTALLVENSSGTDTLEVRDDGRVVAGTGATTNANGTFNVLHGVSNLTTRVFTVSRDSVLRGMDINSGGSTKISDSSGDQSFSHTATAVLEVSSTAKGFLPPRMTSTQRDAIEEPASGLIIYNTTTNKAQCYNGTGWNDMF